MSDKYIIKATGEREIFDPQKLHNSLTKTGAKKSVVDKIISHIEKELIDNITTKEIYTHAFELLKKEDEPKVTARYSLRNAIVDLGPSGFPFEQFVAEIFRAKGFETVTDFMAKGKCAEHEVDIVALYIKARWEDLSETIFSFGKERKLDEGWLITNTKFSESAIKYAMCKNMKLV